MAVTAPATGPSLADRLGGVVVSLRADLQVSRHVQRGVPCYVLHDPVTFQNHRFSVEEYRTAVAIDHNATLGAAFQALCDAGQLDAEDEEVFYEFVIALHKSGLLALPISDDQMLYDRYVRRRSARWRARILGALFLRVPLCNPDAFLQRTMKWVRWLFTPGALAGWLVLMVCAVAAAIGRRGDLLEPLAGTLELGSIPLLVVLLIGLKLIHEFGHAYACRRFGGHVPEMGVFLIVFTPTAYVDATASWGFPRLRHRMIVNLGGMYFESIIAAVALLVWAFTEPSMLNTLAYQAALLASVTTVLFNINPLARFDGYYVLSDLLGVPNLRARAHAELVRLFNRCALGLRSDTSPYTLPMRLGLALFAVASALYRVTIVLGISMIVAIKLFYVGIAIAVVYAGGALVGAITRAFRHFFLAAETAAVRSRAAIVGTALLAGIPAIALFVPVSRQAIASGHVTAEDVRVLRAPAEGVLHLQNVVPGDQVRPGDMLARIEDVMSTGNLEIALAEAHAAAVQVRLTVDQEPADRTRAARLHEAAVRRADDASRQMMRRQLSAPADGVLLAPEPGAGIEGSFVREGDPVAWMRRGPWIIELMIDAESLRGELPQVGELLDCRSEIDPGTVFGARVVRVAPGASRRMAAESLGSEAGGSIMVDPTSGDAVSAHIRVTLAVEHPDAPVRDGATVYVALHDAPQSLADHVRRRVINFMDSVRSQ